MKNRIKGKGRLVYEPTRPGFNKSHKLKTLIIDLPKDDLDLLYQWFIHRHVRSTVWSSETTDIFPRENEHETWLRPYYRRGELVKLQRPLYGKHITIVGGNERMPHENFQSAWKKHQGKIVEFEYAPVPRQHSLFWSLPVYGDHLQEFRYELGLPPEGDFHITIGRQYDFQPIPISARRRASEIRKEMETQGIL